MRAVLNDQLLTEQFDKDGYVQVNLLKDNEISEVKQMLLDLKKESLKDGAHVDSTYKLSFFDKNDSYRQLVFNTIANYFQPKVDRFLDNYTPLIINVFDKEPGGGEVPVHQNWTFVDEDKFTSVSVWIPLCDTTRHNGTLEFVPGSHRVLCKYRSPSIPWWFEDLYGPLREKYLQPLDTKVGQAGILDDSIIHWSSENNSDAVRTTIQLIMVPKDATPIHYYRPSKDSEEVEIYKVNPAFFTRFNMKDKPSGDGVEKIGTASFKPFRLTESEMVDIIATQNPAIKELV